MPKAAKSVSGAKTLEMSVEKNIKESAKPSEPKENAREKAALAAAVKVRKDFKNLQVKKSGKAMADVIKEFPEYEAEFKMLRAELLEPTARRDREALEAKSKEGNARASGGSAAGGSGGRGLTVEMLTLASEAVALKPNWINAVEKYATWLLQDAGSAEESFKLCSQAIVYLQEGNRPVDDKVLQVLEDEESLLQRLLDLDDREDVQYLVHRLLVLKFKAGQVILQAEGLLSHGLQGEENSIFIYEASQIPFVGRD
eukprot:CAMPEP_0113668630 /NCGR_PEP_ID=MMETSP0038_2-20120614/4109_1 /TAXON_ID=2898 /ORGANISM="Cryptomonas paramecium" /LENGTH=255 /DNA_ID=CAMNT_0000584399 /DNA_START=193 /DNA_END=957 /DNA_ORIENTATION=+ /assembly_acc=CAM_ASM_000170